MIKSVCAPGQKCLDDFAKHPKIYWEFEDLIEQYKERYGQDTPFDEIDLYEYTFQMRGKSRLKQMSRPAFFGLYAQYIKHKKRWNK
jgi:hypothetical protein